MNGMQSQQDLCWSPRNPEAGLCRPEAQSRVFAAHIRQPEGYTPGAFATLGKAAPSLEGKSGKGLSEQATLGLGASVPKRSSGDAPWHPLQSH